MITRRRVQIVAASFLAMFAVSCQQIEEAIKKEPPLRKAPPIPEEAPIEQESVPSMGEKQDESLLVEIQNLRERNGELEAQLLVAQQSLKDERAAAATARSSEDQLAQELKRQENIAQLQEEENRDLKTKLLKSRIETLRAQQMVEQLRIRSLEPEIAK